MRWVLVLLAVGCGGSERVELPRKTLYFTVSTKEGQETAVNCYGLIFMSELRVRAFCQYTQLGDPGGPFGTFDTFETAVEYLPQVDAVQLRFYVAEEYRRFYPSSEGTVMKISLAPGGRGWVGQAVYYPYNSTHVYADRPVEAWE